MRWLMVLATLFSTAVMAANPQVKLETSKGDIVLELYEDKAPATVANFLGYVESGFYAGTVFHRIIPNFMVQGGGFDQQYQQKKTRAPIQNEADNGLSNTRGTIAMARTGDPHSATAQFFINTVDNGPLDFTAKHPRGWGYAVFGKVVSGMDVVDAISATPTGVGKLQGYPARDVPTTPVIIKSATLVTPAAKP